MSVVIKSSSELVVGSSLVNNADGIFTWIINLSERWIGHEVIQEKSGDLTHLKIVLDNGTKQGVVCLEGFASSQYKVLSEIEKDQIVVNLIHKELLAKDNTLVAVLKKD